ncbi:RNA polymerase sigma-70 factor [Streptomyces oceani]|uniref:RNA polymerase subunit sigma-24 n=1 Tax=Streptomyces oceani TaxID=1075402 RepID=A0A1E7JMQ5_9ACTN|nr:RNA polymerase sigma-70 factor [Streptomyces oceani]OEU89551.1 RNA polymerase subunit sigma-24 [Streptomyces oceani]
MSAAQGATGDAVSEEPEEFEGYRSRLLGVAYRMLGTVDDAEDVVQEAWLRWSAADRTDVREPAAYLTRVTTRLALDRLRQVRARRESYVGPWLPEPLPTERGPRAEPDGARWVEVAESVSFALLVVLESLSPAERAVFVLREAFGYPFAEIADTLDRSEPAVRQMAGRARRHVRQRQPRFEVDPAQQRRLTERFLTAAVSGDLAGLLDVLAPDVRLIGDSGGKAKAPLRVMESADKVGRFLAAVGQTELPAPEFTFPEFNGAVGLLVCSESRAHSAVLLEVVGERVQTIYLLTNPDKLTRLSPTSD